MPVKLGLKPDWGAKTRLKTWNNASKKDINQHCIDTQRLLSEQDRSLLFIEVHKVFTIFALTF